MWGCPEMNSIYRNFVLQVEECSLEDDFLLTFSCLRNKVYGLFTRLFHLQKIEIKLSSNLGSLRAVWVFEL